MTDREQFTWPPRAPISFVRPRRHRWTVWHSVAAWAGFWLIVGLYLGVAL